MQIATVSFKLEGEELKMDWEAGEEFEKDHIPDVRDALHQLSEQLNDAWVLHIAKKAYQKGEDEALGAV